MAFNKRTWKGRQGTGLNKFSINGATPVTVVNQPDTITEVGDALSAGNLNDLENRIANAFDETASQEEVTNLSNALQATNARVENLEQEHGSYQEVTVKSPYTVPSGKAKNWAVNVLRGVTRGKNQLWNINAPLTSPNMNNYQHSGFSFSWHDTANNNNYIGLRITPSHKYCLSIKNTTTLPLTLAFFDTYVFLGTVPANSIFSTVVDAPSTGTKIILFCAESWTGDRTLSAENFIVTDLTTYFNGNISSDAQTIADIQQNYPELLVTSDYGSSLVSTEYDGVKFVSPNIFDEVTEVGFIDANGANQVASDAMRSKNYIPVIPSESYYLKSSYTTSARAVWVSFYDVSKTFIERVRMDNLASGNGYGSGVIPNMASSFFIRFAVANLPTPVTYNNDIQICLNSYADKTTYHPYMTDTLSLPSPIKLRSAGSVAEEFDLETGEKTNPLGSFLGTEMTLVRLTQQNMNLYVSVDSQAKPNTFNLVNSFGLPVVDAFDSSTETSEVIQKATGTGVFYVLLKTTRTLSDFLAYYELATPDAPTQLDPIENPYLPTEAGGTISSILTEAVDDSMTLGYINL